MLLAIALSAFAFGDAPPARLDDNAAYREAEQKAGRDADAHVKLALWAESKGLTADRAKHLAMAVAADPSHAIARGLMGFVLDGDKWRRPEDVAGQITSDVELANAMAEYETRRHAAAPTGEGQWKLAQWCDKNNLKPQAEAHALSATRLDPSIKAAWQRLGYKNRNGRWLTEQQITDAKREAHAQERANREWKPRLERLRNDLRDPARKGFALTQIAAVSDPRALPSIVRIFATADPDDQAILVQMLGQIDGGPASKVLVNASLFADTAETRRVSTETLVRRDPRDFVSDVIDQIREVRKYEVRPVNGPGSTGVLFVEGKQFDVRRRYEAPSLNLRDQQFLNQLNTLKNGGVVWGADALLVPRSNVNRDAAASEIARREQVAISNLSEMVRAAQSAQRQMERDVAEIEAYNANAKILNDRAVGLLSATTGGDVGPDRESWMKWWSDRQGYAFVSPPSEPIRPVLDQNVPLEYQPQIIDRVGHSCFAAGTPVRTRNGPRPIETLRVGDLVLSQDVATGRLAFEPIVAVYHNPPASIVEVRTDSDAIVATGIHRFWAAGRGWVMARDLTPGDQIRTSSGTAKVQAITARATQPVFNLEVARGRSFFAGKSEALVHDNSLVETTPEPFDRIEARSNTSGHPTTK